MSDVARVGVLCCALFAGGLGVVPRDASGQRTADRKASEVSLPAAVEAAFRKAYPRAIIKNVSREGPDYEIESLDGSQARDLIYRADGTLVSYEEVIAEHDVPAAVLTAIKKRFPDLAMTTFEKVVTDARVSYEATGRRAGKRVEVELTESGAWLSPTPEK